MKELNSKSGFYGLGIAPIILDTLKKNNLVAPTPIQEKAIPTLIEGKDMIGIAQTGTGKTLAFGIPLVQNILRQRGIALIVVPTRELAFQVNDVIRLFSPALNLRSVVLVGGDSMYRQVQMLRRSPHILVGTPGRIMDHLRRRNLTLSSVKILVLDEADRMFDMGFAPQIKEILQNVPKEKQTMLFSATMPESIVSIARAYMKLPVRVEIAPSGTPIAKITQELIFIDKDSKLNLLDSLLRESRGSVLVFTRTKFSAEKTSRAIRAMGHLAAEIHSNRSLHQRREALEGFKNGKYRVLVATDIAARGIDVHNIELVINYDLPDTPEAYVHRIGRTGRAGASGRAISFATPDQKRDVKDIERLIKKTLSSLQVPSLPAVKTFERKTLDSSESNKRFSSRRTGRYRKPGAWRRRNR